MNKFKAQQYYEYNGFDCKYNIKCFTILTQIFDSRNNYNLESSESNESNESNETN